MSEANYGFENSSKASRNKPKTSYILEEAIASVLIKRSPIGQRMEWCNPRVYSTTSSASSSSATSPTASNQASRKNSSEEVKSSTAKSRSRYTFYSMSLVEHRIVKPGTNCLPFPWTHDSDRTSDSDSSR